MTWLHTARSGLVTAGAALLVVVCQRATPAIDTAVVRADSVRRDSIARTRQDSINRTVPGYVIDSVHPIDEEIRRFKARTGGAPVSVLRHASLSRVELVKRVVEDVAKGDSADLALTAVTPREFIDLIFPSSPYTHPPYRESPAVVWMEIANPSSSGYRRLIRRNGGQNFKFESSTCDQKPERQGKNTLWLNCSVLIITPRKETTTQRWFSTIIERDGRFKILSFQNEY